MTIKKTLECHVIIHTATAGTSAVGAGLAQAPCADNIIIAPIQLLMVIALGAVFGINLDNSTAKALIGSTITNITGRGISQVAVGWIPVAGNIINAVTAGALTEGMGWIIARTFEKMQETEIDDYESCLKETLNKMSREELIKMFDTAA